MAEKRWYKGNTHTHTNNSDGDSPLDAVAKWYKGHGYNFVVISDHNKLTDVSRGDSVSRPSDPAGRPHKGDGDFILIAGCEVSLTGEGKPVHVVGMNLKTLPDLGSSDTIVNTLSKGVKSVLDADGIPQVTHPNFRWAFADAELREVEGYRLLEIYNTSTDSNNFGAGGSPSVEDIWDRLLSAGKEVYAVACDDSHHFTGEFYGHRSPPGLSWVMVRADELTPEAIVDALNRGDFYSSTEVTLEDYSISQDGIYLRIQRDYDYKYTTRFVGQGGWVLAESYGTEASYTFQGNEAYVRAKVFSSNGGYAWTQPVFRRKA